MTKRMWMVRAGRGAESIDDFIEKGVVAIGWDGLGDIPKGASREDIAKKLISENPARSKSRVANNAGQIWRYINEIEVGDYVVSYDPGRRVYHVGEIKTNVRWVLGEIEELPRVRSVKWLGEVARDIISTATKNTLGAISTLFLLSEDAMQELLAKLKAEQAPTPAIEPENEEEEEAQDIARDLRARSREFIKDKISRLDWQEMQELVAGLLRAMGYKTRISPSGPDRGKDILASPDGFGFESPRIVVEVKHRPNETIGAQAIRSFLGGRHKDDKGLYVSTGGFSKDARYEAERASIPLVLLDLDDLVMEILRHYQSMDMEARSLIPLTNIYWPA